MRGGPIDGTRPEEEFSGREKERGREDGEERRVKSRTGMTKWLQPNSIEMTYSHTIL